MLVTGERITAVGPAAQVTAPQGVEVIDLPGDTLLPGLMDIHSHLFLHPYDETLWEDQVLKEPLSYRTLRAGRQATATLMAGFTTLRDLGTEGAGDADVGLKRAIEDGIVPGPRLFVATRAIVATGAYGPARRTYAGVADLPQGRAGGERGGGGGQGGARAGRARRRLDQALRRLSRWTGWGPPSRPSPRPS